MNSFRYLEIQIEIFFLQLSSLSLTVEMIVSYYAINVSLAELYLKKRDMNDKST